MDKALEFYRAVKRYNPNPWHAVTRGLTLKWATELPWPRPILELGGQDGNVMKLSGRFVDVMVDIFITVGPGKVYGKVIRGDAQSLTLGDAEFSTVVALNMIYHCDRDRVLAECHRVLNPSGLLIVTDSPGYSKVLTWPYLLEQAGKKEMAAEWRQKEYALHKVETVPWEWWDTIESKGWQVITRSQYCSLSLGRIVRACETLRIFPDIEAPSSAMIEQAERLALQRDRIEDYLLQDEAMCREEGGVFLYLALRRVP